MTADWSTPWIWLTCIKTLSSSPSQRLFFSLFLAICARFIARYGGSPSALLSSRHDIVPNPAGIIFSAIEPKS